MGRICTYICLLILGGGPPRSVIFGGIWAAEPSDDTLTAVIPPHSLITAARFDG